MGGVPVARPNPLPRGDWLFPRRSALVVLFALTLCGLLGVALAVAWPQPDRAASRQWVDAGRVEQLTAGQPVRSADGSFWLVRDEEGGVAALVARSPHLGCQVVWRPDMVFNSRQGWFRDQCHGSTFAVDGTRAFGPSPRDMDRFRVSISDGHIRVNVGEVICSDGRPECEPRGALRPPYPSD